MPPRYVYWTILAGGLPTAFRAAEREELLPTFHRLREKHPDAELKYFARGRLWNSRDEAQAARTAEVKSPSRGRNWRPGGEHVDPRQRFSDERKAKNQARRQERWNHKNGASDQTRRPLPDAPRDRPTRESKPPTGFRPSRPPSGAGERWNTPKPPRGSKGGDRGPGATGNDRPWRPEGAGAGRPPRPKGSDRPWRREVASRPPRSEAGNRPWRPKGGDRGPGTVGNDRPLRPAGAGSGRPRPKGTDRFPRPSTGSGRGRPTGRPPGKPAGKPPGGGRGRR
jgi:23S rRNA pseudouridine2604 synthase